MAISAYTGVPGAGKSYAMISQVIVPGVARGRRVLTNIEGVKPELIADYCHKRWPENNIGEVVLFDGKDALKPGFFPTEEIPDDETFVKGGDLIVFDEWRLYFPRRGKHPNDELEAFLRWHRHLVDQSGQTCDVVIGTQLPTDVHTDYRGLISTSYKFRKLKSLGMNKTYAYHVYEGHLQPKGGHYADGNGRYKKEVFALYSSYTAGADGTENNTDARQTIWKKSLIFIVGGVIAMMAIGAYGAYSFFSPDALTPEQEGAIDPATQASNLAPGSQQPQSVPISQLSDAPGGWRIVGQLVGDSGPLVIASDGTSTRLLDPEGFNWRDGRPVSGPMGRHQIFAEDRVTVTREPGMIELGL